MKTAVVLGAGAWGSTLALLLQQKGYQVCLWPCRHRPLDPSILDAPLIFVAVSMAGVGSLLSQMQGWRIPAGTVLVSATKGLDPKTRQTPARLWQQAFPEVPVVVLSGPNLSQEIQKGLPAATVVASYQPAAATAVQEALSSETFRVYTNRDPLGVELGGTLKNVMAIAAGVCDGLHLGANAKAGLITRGLQEMIRVGVRLGALAETFRGLSGLGDLLATCHSPLSRNYRLGYGLAQGYSLEQLRQSIEGTIEGLHTAPVLVELAAEYGVPVPISWEVTRLLRGETTPQAGLAALMERQVRPEYDLE
ncbi:MAG: NAD(P)H-dependent glycerol-3-phosphate dehydrogenase, partial [Thermostichales cyanobacterium BF4_bins_65]